MATTRPSRGACQVQISAADSLVESRGCPGTTKTGPLSTFVDSGPVQGCLYLISAAISAGTVAVSRSTDTALQTPAVTR